MNMERPKGFGLRQLTPHAMHPIDSICIAFSRRPPMSYLLVGRKPNVSYFRVFGCKCYIYKKRQYLGKFQRRCDIGFMVGYSASSKAYRVYNESTRIVEETYDVEFNETNERYGEIYGDEDEEEQRMAMKKM